MSGTPKRIARLAVAVLFVVPTLLIAAGTSSVAAPTQAEVEAAEASQRDRARARGRDRAVQRRSAPGGPGPPRRRSGRQAGRGGARGRSDGPARGAGRRGLHGRRLPDGRAAGRVGPVRVLRPAGVHGRARPERRRPRRGCVERPATGRMGRRSATRRRSRRSRPSSSRWRPSARDPADARRAEGPGRPAEPGVPGVHRAAGGPGCGRRCRRGSCGRRHGTGGSTDTTGGGGGFVPPPDSSAAGVAIAAAQSVLGAPYVWGSAGPDAFDCSGLTSWAYAQAGVYLPHSSAAQASSFPEVSYSSAQPGDLLFFYSPISHVSLYLGGGMMIHAASGPRRRGTDRVGVRLRHPGRQGHQADLTAVHPPVRAPVGCVAWRGPSPQPPTTST